MSILIKDIEMPQKCGQCKLFHAEYPMYCMAVEGYRTVGAPYGMPKPNWCPLVEIKEPHGNLVDINQMVNDFWDGNSMMIGEHELKQIKTVVEAEE